MERGTEREASFPPSGMDIQDDGDSRKDTGLHKVRDTVGDRAARVAREGPIHIHMVERRDTLVGGAGALAQLRHQNHAAADLLGQDVPAQALGGDLPLPLIAMRSAEDLAGREAGILAVALKLHLVTKPGKPAE